MYFGAEFDDDVFEKPKEKRPKSPIKQGAKVHTPKWFLEPNMTSNDAEEHLLSLRHKANYQYFMKEYSLASVTYEHCLKLLPLANVTGRRECMENLSRSLLHMGCAEKALEWALKMHAAAVNTDQKIVSLNLLATVCHALEKYEEELEALHSCLEPHKSNPDLWFRLAYCYAGMFKIDLPHSSRKNRSLPYCCAFRSRIAISESPESNVDRCPEQSDGKNDDALHQCLSETNCDTLQHITSKTNCEDEGPKRISLEIVGRCEMCTLGVQLISACLLRARLLMNTFEKSHLTEEKYHQMNEKITECLTHMEVEQSFIDEASKMLKTELFGGLPQIAKEITSVV